jgi:hypothetical protein
MSTSGIEAAFAAALADRTMPVPAGVVGTPQRFAVHRNTVAAGLAGALAARFPIVERIVGQSFFRAMAAAYAARHPPRRALLIDYGDAMPAFIEAFAPAQTLPYLPDMARLEIARSQAYHAADARPITAGDLAAIPADGLAGVTAKAHPSAHLLASHHPIATIAAMHAPGAEPGPIEALPGEAVLVTRPALEVRTVRLSAGEHACLAALFAGAALGEAVVAAIDAEAGFAADRALAFLVTSGAIGTLDPEPRP